MKKVFALKISRLAVFFGLLLTSCHDQLNQSPISTISVASFWNSPDDVNGYLTGMYARFRTPALSNLFLWGEARSEVEVQSFGIETGTNFIFSNELSRTRPGPTWQSMYAVVHDANLLIKYTPRIEFGVENERKNILAQAYTMRAFLYYVMTRTWGDLPLVLEPIESYSAELVQRGRSSQADIFQSIKSDIETALGLFPNNDFPKGRHLWSKPALNALKGDVYLWTAKRMGGGDADFNTALTALYDAEQSDVVLLDKFSEIFDYTNKGNKEVMMAVAILDLEQGQTIFSNMGLSGSAVPPDMDDEAKATFGILGGAAYYAVSDAVRQQFSDDDQRKKASFVEVFKVNGGIKTYYTTVPWKFDGMIKNNIRYYYDDVVLYRYADVILMKAEAKNALGQDPSAEMNKIRERAFQENYDTHIFVNGSKEANDVAILQERLLELLFEGKYWWDLIRFDKAFELVPSFADKQNDKYLLLFPISETTLSLEPNVQQNPGW